MCDNIFSCNICKKVFKNQKSLVKHEEKCKNKTPFTCLYCECEFTSKQNVERHIVRCKTKSIYDREQSHLRRITELETLLEQEKQSKICSSVSSNHQEIISQKTDLIDSLHRELDKKSILYIYIEEEYNKLKHEFSLYRNQICDKDIEWQKHYSAIVNDYKSLVKQLTDRNH
jgi:hypothetical protein